MLICMLNRSMWPVLNDHWIVISFLRMPIVICILVMIIVPVNYSHHHGVVSCRTEVMTRGIDTRKSSIVVEVMRVMSALHYIGQMQSHSRWLLSMAAR